MDTTGVVTGAASMEPAGILTTALSSGPIGLGVFILLILLSVFSWTITFAKYFQYKKARAASEEFYGLLFELRDFDRVFDVSRRLEASPLAQLFVAGYRELTKHATRGAFDRETVRLALNRASSVEAHRLEQGTTFLATVASAAPFIGLFGTVWGIMNAFQGLSVAKSTSIQAVAPGISEALIATAVGLAAAIPAAVAYNYCAVAVRRFKENMDQFVSDFLVLAERS